MEEDVYRKWKLR